MNRAILHIGFLLMLGMTVGLADLSAQDSGGVLPSIAKRNVSRELNDYVETQAKDKHRDKAEINAKWAEIARKHAQTVQTAGLSETERYHLADLYAWAKMYDQAIKWYSEFAVGSDARSRKTAKMILDLQIEDGSKSLDQIRASLNEYRSRFSPDIKDMLGLYSQVRTLARRAAIEGQADVAVSVFQDELARLTFDHPYYSWQLAVESLEYYKFAGRLAEGLERLMEYEATLRNIVEKRRAEVPGDTETAEKYNGLTDRFEHLAQLMKNAYRRESLVGQEAPAFNFTHFFNTDPIDYASLRGKVVVIDFWATWCLPCIENFPVLRAFYDKYKGRGVELIGVTGFQGRMSNHGASTIVNISREKELALMKRFIGYQKITWPIAFSDRNCYDPAYGIDTIPRVVVIDKEGKLRLLIHSAQMDEIINMVETLLAENE